MVETDFAFALKALRNGRKVFRKGWNGKVAGLNMFLELQVPDQHSKMTKPYIYMNVGCEKEEGLSRIPWVASQLDLLADDWTAL